MNFAFWLNIIKMKCFLPVSRYTNEILTSGEFDKKHISIKEFQRTTLKNRVKPCGPRARTARGPKGGTSTPSNIQTCETMCPSIEDMIR